MQNLAAVSKIRVSAIAVLLFSACLSAPAFTASNGAVYAEFEHLQPLPGYPGRGANVFKFGGTLLFHRFAIEVEGGKHVGEWFDTDSVQRESEHEYIGNIKVGVSAPLFSWLHFSVLGGGNYARFEGDDCPFTEEDDYCKESDKHRLGGVASASALVKVNTHSVRLTASRYWLTTHLQYESIALSYQLWVQ